MKKPWLAMVLSAVLPGLGQIYNGVFGKGLMLMGLNFIIAVLNRDFVKQAMEQNIDGSDRNFFLAYMAAGLALTAFAMVDAKMDADRRNRVQRRD